MYEIRGYKLFLFLLILTTKLDLISRDKMEKDTNPDLHSLNSKQRILEILSKILIIEESDESLKILDLNFTSGSKAGDNYLSNLQRATVNGIRGNGEGYLKSFIVKYALNQDQHSTFFNYSKLWFNEINIYREVIPRIEKVCGKKIHHPKLLYGDADNIILEDLKPLGYVMVDRRTGMDLDHAKIALEAVADFHSSSMIIRQNDSNEYNMIKNKIGTHPYQEDEGIIGTVPIMQNAIDSAVKKLTSLDGGKHKYNSFIEYITKVKEDIYNILKSIINMKSSIFTVIAHGDFYINNFLFSYSEDRKVKSIMLVDFQGTRIMNLMIDLHHMIYTSVQPKVRQDYLDKLLRHYHDHLCSNLRRSDILDIDYLENDLSFDNFIREFDNNHVVGLLSALTILPAMTYSPDNIPEMSKVTKSWEKNNDDENMEQFNTRDLTERLEDLAKEYIKKGWCKL